MKSSEQKLVDLMFAIAIMTKQDERVQKMGREEHMEWVAESLRRAGYHTVPMGLSWGVLQPTPPPLDDKRITIVEPYRGD